MNLIDRMVELAAARDHEVLDATLCSIVHELAHARSVRIERPEGDAFAAATGGGIGTAGEPRTLLPEAPVRRAGAPVHMRRVRDGWLVLVTLVSGGEHAGWLEVVCDRPLHDGTIGLLGGIARLHGQLHGLIDHGDRDHLTGLLNRSRLASTFARMMQPPPATADAPADAGGLWIAVADIDHFKRINDRFGHVFGDEVLVLIARLLRTQLRTFDRVFRTGGEEFTILLNRVGPAGALSILQRLREGAQRQRLPQGDRVSVSIGYSQVRDGDSPVSAFERADAALYAAKVQGRNRVVNFDDIETSHAPVEMNVEAELF